MIEKDNTIFEAVRRGYSELDFASNSQIIDYFDNVAPDAMSGHISNIKGIVFEQEVVNALNEQGLESLMFEAVNHPISDIALMDDGDIAAEIQLKATDSISYINETLSEYPDVPIIATTEVANGFDSDMVFDSGISNEALGEAVSDTLFDEGATELGSELLNDAVSDSLADVVGESLLPIPVSPIGIVAALLGLPFL